MSSIIVSSTQASTISISAPQVNTISITAPTQRVISGTINLGSAGVPGQGVAAGGTTGQSLVKASGTDYDTTWADRLASVQEDATPQLGGNLDVQTYSITTDSTNQNINIVANGTGYINLDGAVKIKNQATPSVIEGGLYADTSGNIYFGDDTAWKKVLLEDGSVGADLITITAQDGDVATQEKIRISDGTNSDDVVIEAGTNMSISRSGDTITLNNTLANTTLTQEEVEDYAGNLIDSSNTGEQTGITVTYQDATNDVDFVVDDQTLQTSDSEGDQTVVRLTLSQPTSDDTVDITAGNNISFTAITDGGFTIGSDGTASDVSLTDESSDATCFPVFATDATGDQTLHTDTSGLTYDSSTETLEVKNLKVNDATNPYTLPSSDGDDGQVLTTDGAGVVSFAYPKTVSESVKNVSGGTLLKGTPVHVTGSVGNLAEVIAADAATNYPAHFVLDQDLADDGEGQGIALGFINDIDVADASIYSEGQTVYLGASGGWTTTKPTGTNAIQNLGIIIKVNTGGNKISGIIMGAGRSNDVPNLPLGKFFIGSSANTVESAYTLPTADGTENHYLQTDGAGTVSFNQIAYSELSGTPTLPANNGELLIGGTSGLNVSTLTAGTGISITNGDGSITIANTVTDTDTNLGNSDQTLTGARTIDLDGNDLTFDGAVSNVAKINNQGEAEFRRSITAKGYTSGPGTVKFNNSDNTHTVSVQASSALSGTYSLILPTSAGSADQVLSTNGTGVLSWADAATDLNLGDDDLTLSANRVVEMGSNSLDFQSSSVSKFKIFNTGTAQATSRITVNGNGTVGGALRLADAASSNTISLQHPDSGTSYTLKLPSSDGSASQVLSTDGSGNLSFSDHAAKTYGSITCGFFDDIATSAHYLPLNGPPTEQLSDNNSYTDWICPCDIVVKSVQMAFSGFNTGSGNLTVTVEKDPIGSALSTTVESETVAIPSLASSSNYDVIHFLFDNAAVSAGERLKIKVQADSDITNSSNVFVTVVYEADWSTRFTQASGIITS